MIKAVVFDQDGLMFDTERIVKQSWDKSGSSLGYDNLGDNLYETLGFNLESRRAYFLKKYGEAFPFEEFNKRNRRFFQACVETDGIGIKPGLVELLKFLQASGIKAAVATSSSERYVKENLDKTGLRGFFQAVINGNMVTYSKPDPEIYLKACNALDTAPGEAVALEDAPSGIVAASRAGMRVIMVPDLRQPDETTIPLLWATVNSLHEVIPFFEQELKRMGEYK